ncbi:MAG: NAD(P)/FAD-dependent oxidoreductase [Cyclobacteriaceae bacterium]
MKEKVIIIGGGLAGLTVAHELKKQGVNALLLEACDRLGGRIFTKRTGELTFELGATWVFQDEQLKELINELGLDIYPQYLSGDALIKYAPTMALQQAPTDSLMHGAIYHKIAGGTGAIIQALADKLAPSRINLNSQVKSITYDGESITLRTQDGQQFETERLVIAAPPKVVSEQIEISPVLLIENILGSTHTWMGESTKFTVVFDQGFWRKQKLSGFVYSNYGLIREMQDHTSQDGKTFALLGFMQPSEEERQDFAKRKQAVMDELQELFGIRKENILGYDDYLWMDHFSNEAGENYNSALLPHQNNGHAEYLKAHFDGRLVFAGAETSPVNPGYMEGAVRSAHHAVGLLLD